MILALLLKEYILSFHPSTNSGQDLVAVTGKRGSKAGQTALAGGFNGEDQRAVVERRANDHEEGRQPPSYSFFPGNFSPHHAFCS
jgi:hypothetical protein